MRQLIAIKKLRSLVVPANSAPAVNVLQAKQQATTVVASLMSLGYMLSAEGFDRLCDLSETALAKLHREAIPVLTKLKGAHVKHRPMYVNFPQQVMEMSDVELLYNALVHYWSGGRLVPSQHKLPRGMEFEKTKFQELDLITPEQVKGAFTALVASNESLSQEDKEFIAWFMENETDLVFPDVIPFKENMCVVAGLFINEGKDASPLMKTATDVLRVVTYLNDGDVSLATNTKFRSMPRSRRRMFAKVLEKVATEEDIARHRGKWVRLFHNLHIGDYSSKLFALAKRIRSNQHVPTFNGRVQALIDQGKILDASKLLMRRPGEYARRLDHLLRLSSSTNDSGLVVSQFLESKVIDKVSTRVLTQVMGHFCNRMAARENEAVRVVFPKGNTQRAKTIAPALSVSREAAVSLVSGISQALRSRFSQLSSLGKVWIDPDLHGCPIPSGQRSASPGSLNVARGTRLPFGDEEETKNTLRFFIYWVGRDIDLSATLHDENFRMMEQISYTNLRSRSYQAAHSGDITYAPDGASEFIDITIDQAVKHGARYVVMNVLVYRGPTFDQHAECFAGWMTRSKPKSNEIYDAKTVETKVDLRSKSRNAIPVVFDLVDRKAIWCDLTTSRNPGWNRHWSGDGFINWGGNNVHSNKAAIEQVLQAIVTASSKLSLYQLFQLHADARGQQVESKDEADTVFSLYEGITPYDITTISSEYLS